MTALRSAKRLACPDTSARRQPVIGKTAVPADKAVASATGGRPGPGDAPRRPARHLLDVARAIMSRSRSWERWWRGMISVPRTIHVQSSLPFIIAVLSAPFRKPFQF